MSIQGFGNVGAWTARILAASGARIVCIQDASGATSSGAGLDIPQLLAHAGEGGSIGEFPEGETLLAEECPDIACDVFIPAALGGLVTRADADRLRCTTVIEGANSPMSPDAEEIMRERGIVVFPDVMANAGGVIVSYFEWVQNLQHDRWSAERVDQRLREVIRSTYGDVRLQRERSRAPSLRVAAYELALERVLTAARQRNLTSN